MLNAMFVRLNKPWLPALSARMNETNEQDKVLISLYVSPTCTFPIFQIQFARRVLERNEMKGLE